MSFNVLELLEQNDLGIDLQKKKKKSEHQTRK